MTSLQSTVAHESRERQLAPMQLLVDLIRKKPSLERSKQVSLLWKIITDEVNHDYLFAMFNEWVAIKYNSAYAIAVPPTREEIEEQRKARVTKRQQSAKEIANKTKEVTTQVRVNILSLLLPHGKTIGESTFGELAKLGGKFSTFAKHGKPAQVVGAVMSSAEIRKAWSTA